MNPDDPDKPTTPLAQPAHQASSPFHGPDTLNGATSPHQAAGDGTLAADTLRVVEELQTTVGVIQVQLAIALALALLSLSILTYSLKQAP